MSKRWLDFRNGHSIYLVFFMTFANFILLTYNLAITKFWFTKDLFSDPVLFAILFVAVYIPAAMVFGYWHRRSQYVTENEVWMQENWVNAWLNLCLIRVMKGMATKEETERVMNYVEDILRRHKKEHLLRGDN